LDRSFEEGGMRKIGMRTPNAARSSRSSLM
jgi:hypothetical protein